MEPDILAALAAYLQGVMGLSLLSSSGYPQVYSDFAPQGNPDGSPVAQPYAVVTDGPESYTASSGVNPGMVDVIADGVLQVAFYCTTKAEARSLGITAVRLLTDTRVYLGTGDARFMTLLPTQAVSVPLVTEGVQQPTAFARVVTVNYKQEFVQ